eukprot:scaffold180652_cov20-Tisochrysis_lutea.AAC.1
MGMKRKGSPPCQLADSFSVCSACEAVAQGEECMQTRVLDLCEACVHKRVCMAMSFTMSMGVLDL